MQSGSPKAILLTVIPMVMTIDVVMIRGDKLQLGSRMYGIRVQPMADRNVR
jgi:hypothetical protein